MEETCDAVIACYTRTFSQIEGLQTAHQVQYLLYSGKTGLRLEVRKTGQHPNRAWRKLPRGTEGFARRLMQFLYENAVPAELAGDVVDDCWTDVMRTGPAVVV
ncbi:MAG: hypothetical protein U0L91_10050 [Gemmiger sp.]|uniref:hypothetical protein n=1 Tax=Gemmiger sp. TaxID=2049027 RepID=UPI002E7929B5|nr:hypothetical protein [Gemmiger sp.]MEE0801603.1 hypothetical protein [Gemmiger sp.]